MSRVRLFGKHKTIGALEIGLFGIKYLQLKPVTFEVERSVVVNKNLYVGGGFFTETFREALQELRARLNVRPHEIQQIVISLNLPNILTYQFLLPEMPAGEIREAVKLELQNELPLPLHEYYWEYDLQDFDPRAERRHVFTILIPKLLLNDIIEILIQSHFLPLILETTPLSLIRALRRFLGLIPTQKYLVTFLTPTTLLSIYLENLGIRSYLSENIDWHTMTAQEVAERFELEVNKLRNFLETKQLVSPDETIVVSQVFENELRAHLTTTFKDQKFVFPSLATPIEAGWIIAWGLALRALEFPSDQEINLLPISTAGEYALLKAADFLVFWGVLLSLVLIGWNALWFGTGAYLRQAAQEMQERLLQNPLPALEAQYQEQGRIAEEANKEITKIYQIESQNTDWATRMDAFRVQPQNVHIIFLKMNRGSGILKAKAPDQKSVLAFRDSLKRQGVFEQIDLQVNSIQETPQGIFFEVSFRFKQ